MTDLALTEKFTFNKDFVYISPVSTAVQHATMWRWNQRMYNHRYPKTFEFFDMIKQDLGFKWWVQYKAQDWVVRDWHHNQIGSYCLCPITKEAFSKAEKGEIMESEISVSDIKAENSFSNHNYWYLASFIKAKTRAGYPKEFNQYAINLMIAHALSRALWNSDFASATGGEIIIIGFVESPIMKKFANKNRFYKAIPHSKDSKLQTIYVSYWNRDQLFAKLEETIAILSTLNIPDLDKFEEPFLQPPNF